MISAETSLLVPFHDIDIMGIVWHGHYYKYLEIGRTELMKSIDLDWPLLKEAGVAMPIVHSSIRYKQPIQYDGKVFIRAKIKEYQYPELNIDYEIYDPLTKTKHAIGQTRQIYFDYKSGTSFFDVPQFVRERMEKAWDTKH